MKKSFKLENLDCANCAAKMENRINKIEGAKASINFMSQKITLEAEEDRFEEMIKAAQKAIAKVDSDCVIVL